MDTIETKFLIFIWLWYQYYPYFSLTGGKKKSSPCKAGQAPKGPFYASYTPLPQSIFYDCSVNSKFEDKSFGCGAAF
jgi:hypothetical protein